MKLNDKTSVSNEIQLYTGRFNKMANYVKNKGITVLFDCKNMQKNASFLNYALNIE